MPGDTLSTLREVALEALEPRQLMAFGKLDVDFGVNGRATTEVNATTLPVDFYDIEIAPGGKVLGGGTGGLVQWTQGGELDADFAAGGALGLGQAIYRDHEVGSDGKVYVLVSAAAGGVVVRYTSAGQVDSNFGLGGTALISSLSAFRPAAMAVQSDGKVVVVGTVKTDEGKGAITRIYRLEADGSPDMGFGNTASQDVQLGAPTFLTPVVKDTVAGVAVLSGGKIVIGGSSLSYSPEFYDDESGTFRPVVYGDSVFAVARLTADGALDGSYVPGGVARAVYATGINPTPAGAFALKAADDAVGLAAYTDRLVYAQFNASGVVAFNNAAETADFGRPVDMASKLDGRLMIVGRPETFTDHGLQVAYVKPDGSLSNVIQTSDGDVGTEDIYEDAPAAIAVAQDGDILVGGRSAGGAAYQVVKFDDGNPNAQRPDEFAGARGNDIVRDDFGGVHFAFFDAAERVLKYAYRAPNGLWNPTVTVDDAPESGHYLSIAVDANGRPGIAYFDGLLGDLKFAFSPRATEWETQTVESAGLVGLYPSLQFDTSLRATIAYYKKTGGDLKLAVLQPDGVWTYELVDAENDVGRSTALTPQPFSGRWSIAYTDTSTGAVKMAWRTKQRVWQIETAAATVGGADFLSLAYNPSTEPPGVYQRAAISYFDAYTADLKITQSSGDGALIWTPRTLATQGASGFYTTLTFDAFHGPTVYYYNRTADRVTSLTDSVVEGMTAETIVSGGGRYLSVFSNGNTIDLAYFDEDEMTLKVRSLPLRV